jgi:hypothetical protein
MLRHSNNSQCRDSGYWPFAEATDQCWNVGYAQNRLFW